MKFDEIGKMAQEMHDTAVRDSHGAVKAGFSYDACLIACAILVSGGMSPLPQISSEPKLAAQEDSDAA